MTKKYRGVFAVICTPFDEKGDIDELTLRKHIRYLLDQCGVHSIIPTGSTGEFAFLTEAERLRVMEITLDEVNHKVPVFVGTAACSTNETIRYAQLAQNAGADGVMVVSPYYGSLSQEELYGHFSALAQSISIPIIVYNNPGTSGSDILPPVVARLAEFDNIVAIKESSGVMQRVSEIMRLCGDKIEVLCGCDTLILEMFQMGVEGWVAAPANLIGELCVELYDIGVEQKDFEKAKELYFKILPLTTLFESSGKYVQLAKAGLAMRGMPIGEPRKPLLPPDPQLLESLREILDSLGLIKKS
ncbi:MAG: 4-hydroxy-tetrahydrodipicolinate synthase [Anaerolineales bacterium]